MILSIERDYQRRELNWRLLPDLLREFEDSLSDSDLTDANYKTLAVPRFDVVTFSQHVVTDSSTAFLEFLQTSVETPSQVGAVLECHRAPDRFAPYEIQPPFFKFFWSERRTYAQVTRTSTTNALEFLETFAAKLQLEPSRPVQTKQEEQARVPKRTAFIAHSFDSTGRSYAFQLTKFLSLLGFEVATGEGFAPERVSAKVRRRLLAQELALVVLSEQQDFTWLTHEAVGASVQNKPLFLLVEKGVEFKPGILGDIEYISFPEGHVSEAFTPIIEGLRELGFRFR